MRRKEGVAGAQGVRKYGIVIVIQGRACIWFVMMRGTERESRKGSQGNGKAWRGMASRRGGDLLKPGFAFRGSISIVNVEYC